MSILNSLRAAAPAANVAPAQRPPLQQAPAMQPAQPFAPAPSAQPASQAPAASRHNPYAGLDTAQASNKQPRLPIGLHVLKIIQVRDGNLAAAIGGNFYFAADFEVVETTNPDFPVGSTAGWMTVLAKFPAYFKSDVKAFLMAATGFSAEQVTDSTALEATAQDNPLRDRLIIAQVTAKSKVDPKTGQPYTDVKFSVAPQPQQ
jgi:hypothetical protein